MKFIIKIVLTILFINAFQNIFSAEEMPKTHSTLIIIDEQQNGNLKIEDSPFSDGVYDALWEKESSIFFDMRLSEPMKISANQIEIDPSYLKAANESRSDTIMLFKINYSFVQTGKEFQIKVDEISYKIYSLPQGKAVKTGVKKINIDQKIQDNNGKIILLKKIGSDFLNEIYSR